MEAVDWGSHALMLCDSIVYFFPLTANLSLIIMLIEIIRPQEKIEVYEWLSIEEKGPWASQVRMSEHTTSLISSHAVWCLILLPVPSIAILYHPLENNQNMIQDDSLVEEQSVQPLGGCRFKTEITVSSNLTVFPARASFIYRRNVYLMTHFLTKAALLSFF